MFLREFPALSLPYGVGVAWAPCWRGWGGHSKAETAKAATPFGVAA